MKFRGHFDYDVEAASDAAAVFPVGDSLTVQSMMEDADLNVIMRRFGIGGRLPENPRVPTYGDFSGVTDYRSCLHAIMAADEAFGELPAEVRARFEHNPQRLLEFVDNPANIEQVKVIFGVKNGEPRISSVGGGAAPAPGGAGAAAGAAAGGNPPAAAGGAGGPGVGQAAGSTAG